VDKKGRHPRTGSQCAKPLGLFETYLSLLHNSQVQGVRFETLGKLFQLLDGIPVDLLTYEPETDDAGDETHSEA